jgi:hypothetical protein
MKIQITALLISLVAVTAAPAWDRHDVVTKAILLDVAWLDQIPPCTVTPWKDTIPGVQHSYQFPFKGEKVGEQLTPREILVRYADEPDWGVDQNLDASWQQYFMGGKTGFSSQAYFHMYYPAFTVHAPVPGIVMGAANKRADLWVTMSRKAFARKDPYWGFRYLACAFHYVEDLGQPYHSTQTSVHFVDICHVLSGTVAITSNFHYVYEGWIAHQMLAELEGSKGFGLVAALRGTDEISLATPSDFVKKVAKSSHAPASVVMKSCIQFFDRRFLKPENVEATEADFAQMTPEAPRDQLVKFTLPGLKVSGQAIRGLLGDLRPAMPGSRGLAAE